VVEAADRLIANTHAEADDLVQLYGAAPGGSTWCIPAWTSTSFRPASAHDARARVGIDPQADVLMFVGRLQSLKAP
jgi:D-inositol-3-phosphate glycosyltransferase